MAARILKPHGDEIEGTVGNARVDMHSTVVLPLGQILVFVHILALP
jgi:hypothetical protein